MDDVLGRKTGDVLAGTSDIFSFNGYGLHPLFGQGPGDEFARPSRCPIRGDRILPGLKAEKFARGAGK